MAYSYVKHEPYDQWNCGHVAYLCGDDGEVVDNTQLFFEHLQDGDSRDEWATEFCNDFWPDVPVRLDLCDVQAVGKKCI